MILAFLFLFLFSQFELHSFFFFFSAKICVLQYWLLKNKNGSRILSVAVVLSLYRLYKSILSPLSKCPFLCKIKNTVHQIASKHLTTGPVKQLKVLQIATVTCKNTGYCSNLYVLFYAFLFDLSLSFLLFFFFFPLLSLCPAAHSLCSALPNSSLNLSQTLFLSIALALPLSSGLSMAVGLRM